MMRADGSKSAIAPPYPASRQTIADSLCFFATSGHELVNISLFRDGRRMFTDHPTSGHGHTSGRRVAVDDVDWRVDVADYQSVSLGQKTTTSCRTGTTTGFAHLANETDHGRTCSVCIHAQNLTSKRVTRCATNGVEYRVVSKSLFAQNTM